ncbi:Glycosyl hydrolase 92 [Macrophomina phaseolina MS6]|uniref:Glycosyl hydrolase 92 n=1 Tax=Macrophomina phaseolina (strain MS6) TaxID=1126212 RepID=K2RZZ5_MACPH|nr:Glycosyl hydrolase 92 [Macrophomina phaseolina MS6]
MRTSPPCLSLLLVLLAKIANTQDDLAAYVDPMIGTSGTVPGTAYNAGNVFPGAAVPFGAVKCGIDTTVFNNSFNANGGYTPDGNVTAISLLHESGTGGAVKYGVVAQMPLASLAGVNVLDNLTYAQRRVGQDEASPGYFKTELGNGVTAEMSATQHVGVMKYSYQTEGERYVLVDVSHYLPTNDEVAFAQFYSNGRLDLEEDGSYSGGGWNGDPNYQVHFCGRFDTAPTTATLFSGPYTDPFWPNSTATGDAVVPTWHNASTSLAGGPPGYSTANRIGALFAFPPNTTTLTSKVGVSWISVAKACQFADEEVVSWDLGATAQAARAMWNDDVLARIKTGDRANATRLTMLYSALYKAHLIPSDRTGENPHWTSEEPYYDDFYTLWDTFRCLNSLWLLLEPARAAGMVRSLVDIWRHERFMPDGRSSNYNGRVQGGSNADNVLADAFVKGLEYGINWTDAYAAMKTDAEVVPYNTFDTEDPTQSTKEGRGALRDWLDYGFVTPNYGRSVSKTVEYALNDFALSQVAKDLAPDDYPKYLQRSAIPASLQPYDPTTCGGCEWSSIAYEATPWEYSWTIPFDMQTLITLMGDAAAAEDRLDTMFVPGLRPGSVGSGGSNTNGDALFNPGNEPSFTTPFLYNYFARRQHRSVLRARQVVNQYYGVSPSGLPGNSDGGALDSWLVWNLLGLYPVVTQPVYLILSPWFADLTIRMPSPEGPEGVDRWLNVTAEGLGEESFYVQSLKVNGVSWDKSWLSHEDIKAGATLEFVLGAEPVEWDTGELPPSPGHVEL